MENTSLSIKERELYETFVKFDKTKFDTRLRITDKRVIFENKSGFFKKEYKIIDTININDIIVDQNKVKIDNNDLTVIIETNDKIYKFTCNNMQDVKVIKSKIIKLKDDSTLLEKTSKGVTRTAKAIGGIVVSIATLAVTINKHKGEILEATDTIKHVFKKK